MNIDLVVITYKPEESFVEMIEKVSNQSVAPNRIIVYNVEQKYFDRIAYSGRKFLNEHKNMEIHHVSKREYDCGKTRNAAVKTSNADFVLFMAQDALPTDERVIERLVNKLKSDPSIAVAYSGQIARDDSTEDYKLMKTLFYPNDSCVRTDKDAATLGWMAYISSNVCAVYRRSIFDELGGFGNHVIAGEDILFAAKALHAGYKVAYVAESTVVYSEGWNREQMESFSFDVAVSHAKHPELFDSDAIKNMMKKHSKLIVSQLKRNGHAKESLAARKRFRIIYKSYKQGLKFKHMSKSEILRSTANPEYWRMDELMRDRSAINARLGYGRSEEEVAMLKQTPIMHRDED